MLLYTIESTESDENYTIVYTVIVSVSRHKGFCCPIQTVRLSLLTKASRMAWVGGPMCPRVSSQCESGIQNKTKQG